MNDDEKSIEESERLIAKYKNVILNKETSIALLKQYIGAHESSIEEHKRKRKQSYVSILNSEAAYKLEEASNSYVHECMKIQFDLEEDLKHA